LICITGRPSSLPVPWQKVLHTMADAVAGQIAQLENARRIVLADPTHYTAVIPGILPIVGPQAHLLIQRWGAEFLAEAFASPVVTMAAKEEMGVKALPTLRSIILSQGDEAVTKSTIQAVTSIYPLIFRHTYVRIVFCF
jgi:symplekin